jgi:hypothetical protein
MLISDCLCCLVPINLWVIYFYLFFDFGGQETFFFSQKHYEYSKHLINLSEQGRSKGYHTIFENDFN